MQDLELLDLLNTPFFLVKHPAAAAEEEEEEEEEEPKPAISLHPRSPISDLSPKIAAALDVESKSAGSRLARRRNFVWKTPRFEIPLSLSPSLPPSRDSRSLPPSPLPSRNSRSLPPSLPPAI